MMTTRTRPRLLLCDDDPARLQAVAHELSLFPTGSTIETTSPRSKFATAVLSSKPHETPRFPILIFMINIGCSGVYPPSIYGTAESKGQPPDPSSYQLFQICHTSTDHLVTDDTLNVLRYGCDVLHRKVKIFLPLFKSVSSVIPRL